MVQAERAMSVYVDQARNPFGRMKMAHMMADGIEELMGMADAIGLAHRHFQPGSFPHFDVSQSYKRRALAAGAVEVDRHGLVACMDRYRRCLATDDEELEMLRLTMEMVRPGQGLRADLMRKRALQEMARPSC